MKKYLVFCLFLGLTGAVTGAVGQTANATSSATPIFITPYKQTVGSGTNTLPSVVQSKQDTSARISNRAKGAIESASTATGSIYKNYKFTEVANPYEGSAFGRVRSEKDYYDAETGTYVNQYDYMGLLASRGETDKLNEVRSYLQKNGVFNPDKYKIAMSGGDSSASGEGAGATSAGGAAATPKQIIVKQNSGDSSIPQKIHSGYGDDEVYDPANHPAPIFLK